MSTMKAVVVRDGRPARLALDDVEAPTAGPGQALVRVAATSLNRGEVRRAQSQPTGERPGWDLAGTVEQAAAGGSGPREGARVVGLVASGAWAEKAVVPVEALAELPDEVSFEQAACLPVAGLTALYGLDKARGSLERNVLVTGASGGAGHFGVQLARVAGAHVVALARRPEHEDMLKNAGAHEVVISEDGSGADQAGPYDFVLDAVGGPVLARSLEMLAPDAVCVTYGATASVDVTVDLGRFFRTGGTKLYGFYLFHEVRREPASSGLGRLTRMVADGRVKPRIEIEARFEEIGGVAERLLQRAFSGKAVVHI